MNDPEMLHYVRHSAALLGFTLADERMERVATQLQRTAAMAQLLSQTELSPDIELAEIYCPQPFPGADTGK